MGALVSRARALDLSRNLTQSFAEDSTNIAALIKAANIKLE